MGPPRLIITQDITHLLFFFFFFPSSAFLHLGNHQSEKQKTKKKHKTKIVVLRDCVRY